MKGLTKSIVALALVIAVLATMGMSAMAEKAYSTKTIYQADNKISVEAKATGLQAGDIVTYVATTDEADVNENTIVYINQDEADANGNAQFTYTTEVTNINASMFFGGSTESTRQEAKHTDDLVINVTVTGGATGTVYAAKQDADAGIVIRKFDLSNIANLAGVNVKEVAFEGQKIENFAVADTTLIVSTDKINANGTLAITTTDAPDFIEPKISASCKYDAENGAIVTVAKAAAGSKFGVVIYDSLINVPTITAHEVVENEQYVVLPALGKNVDGIYAVELQGVLTDYLTNSDKVKVQAYAFNGNECVMSTSAIELLLTDAGL